MQFKSVKSYANVAGRIKHFDQTVTRDMTGSFHSSAVSVKRLHLTQYDKFQIEGGLFGNLGEKTSYIVTETAFRSRPVDRGISYFMRHPEKHADVKCFLNVTIFKISEIW